jgi:O-antigen ligase
VVCLAGGLYVAVVVMLVALATAAGQAVSRPDLFLGYDSYRFFNHVQTAALPLAVLSAALARAQSSWPRWLGVGAWWAAIGGFALLFATMGRGTLVGIAVATGAVLVIFGRRAFPLARTTAIAAGAGLAFFAVLFLALPLLLGVQPALHGDFYAAREGSVQVRLMLWGIALDHVRAAPWLGIGPMHYAHYPTGDASHPHNFYLQVAAEYGLPMFLLVLTIALAGARHMVGAIRACQDPGQRLCGMGLLLACLAIAVDALFSGNLVMPVSQVWSAATVGWALAWMANQQRARQGSADSAAAPRWIAMGRVVPVFLLFSQLWLAFDIWPQAVDLSAHLEETMRQFPTAVTNPRFWSHGWF